MPYRLIIFLSALVLLTSCGSSDWKQFHGGEANVGYIGVNSNPGLIPKWNKPMHIGLITYSSPAIANDGTIYLGTTTGVLVAIKNDGSGFKWIFRSSDELGYINPCIVSSPAIGRNGDIYFTVTYDRTDCVECGYTTSLVKLNPDGNLLISFDLNQKVTGFGLYYTTASPKVLDYQGSDFIFIAYRGSVIGFNADLQEVIRHQLNCSGDLKQPTLPGILDFEGLSLFRGAPGGARYYNEYRAADNHWIDPTIAILRKINQEELAAPLIVVAMNRCGLEAFEWNPPPIPGLKSKWFAPRTFEELLSSPSISESGEVILGSSSGWLFSYDALTGKHNWILNINEPVVSTSSFYAGVTDLYAVGENHLFRIANGSLVNKFPLPAKTQSSCAISMDRIIVSSTGGILSLSIDFTSNVLDNTLFGGMSSPAIGMDGTIYVVTNNGALMAYKGK